MKKRGIPTPPPEPAEPELTPSTARKALAFDLRNLLVKVKSGKPLTRYERTLVEAKLHTPGGAAAPAATFAGSQSELARVLGTSRQLVAYHARQPGSPGRREDGRYPVGEWRSYLQAFGRVAVTEGAAGGRQHSLADAAAVRGLEIAGGVLPVVLSDATKLTPQELARLAVQVFCAMGVRLTGALTADGPRPLPIRTPREILEVSALAGVQCPGGLDVGQDVGSDQEPEPEPSED